MKSNSGIIELKNATIICDDWRQLLDNEWVRLAFCPKSFIPDSVEGFVRIIYDENTNIFFFECNGVLDYISDLYEKIYPNSPAYVDFNHYKNSGSMKSVRLITELVGIQDIFQSFIYLDQLLIRSDMLLPFI